MKRKEKRDEKAGNVVHIRPHTSIKKRIKQVQLSLTALSGNLITKVLSALKKKKKRKRTREESSPFFYVPALLSYSIVQLLLWQSARRRFILRALMMKGLSVLRYSPPLVLGHPISSEETMSQRTGPQTT